jgi:hypothetical protein
MKKVYKSMQGKIVDIETLSARHELTPAVGNVRVNARGDEIGPGGRIVRKREDILNEYYRNNPNAVPDEILQRRPNVAVQQPVLDTTIAIDDLTSENAPIVAPATEDITKRKRTGE